MSDAKVFFKSIKVLSDYKIIVEMGTGSQVSFDFNTRLNTLKYGALKDNW